MRQKRRIRGYFFTMLFLFFAAAVAVSCGGGGGGDTGGGGGNGSGGGGTTPTLASIAVTPANPSIASGNSQQFTATGTYSDSSTQDLTVSVTWNSSDTGVATINSGGSAAGVSAGATTITATSGTISGNTY